MDRENLLKPGEIVTEVVLPATAPGLRSLYRKVRARGAWDFARRPGGALNATPPPP